MGRLNSIIINPFNTTGLFLYPLKTSENQKFADVPRGYRKMLPDVFRGYRKKQVV